MRYLIEARKLLILMTCSFTVLFLVDLLVDMGSLPLITAVALGVATAIAIGVSALSGLKDRDSLSEEDRKWIIARRKSFVRVAVTYAAAAWVFVGSGLLILFPGRLLETPCETCMAAQDLYMMVLPIATGIITYWFAARSNQSNGNSAGSGNATGFAKQEDGADSASASEST